MRNICCAALIWSVAGPARAQPGEWKPVDTEGGIELFEREREGQVEFRSVIILDANIREVFAIMYHHKRRTDWMEAMLEHVLLHRNNAVQRQYYTRLESPYFFIQDRDVVTEIHTKFYPDKQRYEIVFWDIQSKKVPEVDGVVRIPDIWGRWRVTAMGPNRTRVSYDLRSATGGWVPEFAARFVTRHIPTRSLIRLREVLHTPEYEFARSEAAATFDWTGYPEPSTPTAAKQ